MIVPKMTTHVYHSQNIFKLPLIKRQGVTQIPTIIIDNNEYKQ